MKKKGVAAFGDVLGNLATGHLKSFEYKPFMLMWFVLPSTGLV